MCVKPVLNWANITSRTYFGFFVEPKKSSANVAGSSLAERLFREPSWGYSSNCDEAIFGVQKASLNRFWEYSPCSRNIASDWLRAESSPADEEEKEKMDDCIAWYFTRFGGNLFIC